MADFPTSVPDFGADETDGVDFNVAFHINKLRAEVRAIAQEVGTRSAGDAPLSLNVADLLTDVATLKGYFDGSGKLPASGIENFHSPQPLTLSGGLAPWDPTVFAQPKWWVDGGGTCHWQGFLSVGTGIASSALPGGLVGIAGAPAPADGKQHSFKIRYGRPGQDGLGNGGFIIPLSAWHGYSGSDGFGHYYNPPNYYVDEAGMVTLTGTFVPDSVYGVSAGLCFADGVPRPGENRSEIIFAVDNNMTLIPGSPDGGGLAAGAVFPALRPLLVRPDGSMITGPWGSGPGDHLGYWHPEHTYTFVGAHYMGQQPTSLDVLSDGRGAFFGTPMQSGAYISLDGISYYVGT